MVSGNPLADLPPGSGMLILSPEIVGLCGESGDRHLNPVCYRTASLHVEAGHPAFGRPRPRLRVSVAQK